MSVYTRSQVTVAKSADFVAGMTGTAVSMFVSDEAVVGLGGGGEVNVFDFFQTSGTFVARPTLTGGASFGASIACSLRNGCGDVFVSEPAKNTGDGSVTWYRFNFGEGGATAEWTAVDEITGTSAEGFGAQIRLSDNTLWVLSSATGRIRHYDIVADEMAEIPTSASDTSTLTGVTNFTVSRDGKLYVHKTGENGVRIYGRVVNQWVSFGGLAAPGALTNVGTAIETSSDGRLVVAAGDSTALAVYKADLTIDDGETGVLFKLDYDGSIAVPSGTSAISVAGTAQVVGAATSAGVLYSDYADLSKVWTTALSDATLTPTLVAADRNTQAVFAGGSVRLYWAKRTNRADNLVSQTKNSLIGIQIDDQNVENVPDDYFLTRGDTVTAQRGLSVVNRKIVEAIKNITLRGGSDVPSVDALQGIEVHGGAEDVISDGRVLAFSSERGRWGDLETWWQNAFLEPSYEASNLLFPDMVNAGIIFTSGNTYTLSPRGNAVTYYASMPYNWVRGSSVIPVLTWRQDRALLANWLMVIRTFRAGKTDSGLPLESDLVDNINLTTGEGLTDANGFTGIYFYVGKNRYTYTSGELVQQTEFHRLNRTTEQFISEGVPMRISDSEAPFDRMLIILYRDRKNDSGFFGRTGFETNGSTSFDSMIYTVELEYRTRSIGRRKATLEPRFTIE